MSAGYGNLAPKTPEGKLVTMLYALVGVPLMLLCLSNLGTLLAGTFQFAYSHACCNVCAKDNHPERKKQQQNRCYQSMSKGPPCARPQDAVLPVAPMKGPPPVVPSIHVSAAGRSPRMQSRPRVPRPLTPEARQILTECAEYSLAQAGGAEAEPAAAKLLQELQRNDPEAGEEEEDEPEDLEDADQERRYESGTTSHCTHHADYLCVLMLLSRVLSLPSGHFTRLSVLTSGMSYYPLILATHPANPSFHSANSSR